MPRFVVSKVNLYSHEFEHYIMVYVNLNHAYIVESLKDEIINYHDEPISVNDSIEAIKQYYFDSDMLIDIIEITDA